jgi:hypothetical protein
LNELQDLFPICENLFSKVAKMLQSADKTIWPGLPGVIGAEVIDLLYKSGMNFIMII